MKILPLKLTLSFTIISFFSISKWWFVCIDGPDNFMYGFPIAYKRDALHTSLASEYFILEFIIDFLLYFFFWVIIEILLKRNGIQIILPKIVLNLIFTISFVVFVLELVFAFSFDNIISFRNDNYFEVIETGVYHPFFEKSSVRDF